MDRIESRRIARVLLSCALAACAWLAARDVRAQTPVSCSPTIADAVVQEPVHMVVNRTTPMGRLHDKGPPNALPATSHLNCRQGKPGDEIEVEVRFVGGTARPDPYGGAGVLMDSVVPGIGIQVEATLVVDDVHTPLTDPAGKQLVMTRTAAPVQGMSVMVKAFAAKTGDVDLLSDHKVHDQTFLQVSWRPKGQGAFMNAMTFRYVDIGNTVNIYAETCYFGDSPNMPVVRNHRLRTVSGRDFSGVGSEALAYIGVDTYLELKCRNFAGGRLVVNSPSRHPTEPGVLNNGHSGTDAATGLALRLRNAETQAPWNFHAPWPLAPNGDFFSVVIPYSVRYVQTEPTITPGAFSATATLTIEYN